VPAPFIPLRGFAPDLDPTQPGVIVDCQFLLPTVKGMKAAAQPIASTYVPLPAKTNGAATVVLLNGTTRAFAGMAVAIYEAVGGTWKDVTRGAAPGVEVAAGDPLDAHMGKPEVSVAQATERDEDGNVKAVVPYRGTDDNTWRFSQLGNATLAVNGADPIQQSITAGPFADIAGAPVAKCIDVAAGFVMVANTSDATYGERPDAWWCSALYNQANWVPDIGTQCATARLVDTPGANTACRALGSNFVIYKDASMFYGTYQNAPVIWAWNCVSNNVGAPSQEAVINIGTAHVFLGNDNFYFFDGTRPTPIGDEVKEWFFGQRLPSAMYRMRSMHDQRNSLVYWFFVSTNSTDGVTLDRGLVYNYRAKKWGRADYKLESVFEEVIGQITWDSLGSKYATWDDLPKVAYNSPFWVQSSRVPAIIDTAHKLHTLTGKATVSGFATGEIGDDEAYTDLQYVRLRCLNDPDTGRMGGLHRYTLGTDDFETSETAYVDGKFDVDVSARWHALAFAFTGDVEITGYAPTAVKDGEQ
jgi:hypothetical protein